MGIEVTLETLMNSIGKEVFTTDEDNNIISESFDIRFKDPISDEELEKFEREKGVTLPTDYRDMLLWSDGLMFSQCESVNFYRFQRVKNISKDYKSNFIIIGEVFGCYIGINLDEISKEEYMYAAACVENYFIKLDCDFRTFFTRCVLTKENYWEWTKNTESYEFYL